MDDYILDGLEVTWSWLQQRCLFRNVLKESCVRSHHAAKLSTQPFSIFIIARTPTAQMISMKHIGILMTLICGAFSAPFLKEDRARTFLRLKRQVGYWDPNHSQNVWGYTVQEQANEYWTDLRTNLQYYMDMGNLAFDRSTADEYNRQYMEMLRSVRAHLDTHTGPQ